MVQNPLPEIESEMRIKYTRPDCKSEGMYDSQTLRFSAEFAAERIYTGTLVWLPDKNALEIMVRSFIAGLQVSGTAAQEIDDILVQLNSRFDDAPFTGACMCEAGEIRYRGSIAVAESSSPDAIVDAVNDSVFRFDLAVRSSLLPSRFN